MEPSATEGRNKKMKKSLSMPIYLFVSILLFLSIVLLVIYGYFHSKSQDVKISELENSILLNIQQISTLENNNSKLNDTVSSKELEITNLEERIRELDISVTTLTAKNEELSNDKATLEAKVSSLETSYDLLQGQYTTASGIVKELDGLFCDTQLNDVDFSNNESVNESLVSYVERTKSTAEPISAHYFNLIWTGEKHSIHTIEVYSQADNMNYLWKFIVYFRGEAYGRHENGIFNSDDMCWLYFHQ